MHLHDLQPNEIEALAHAYQRAFTSPPWSKKPMSLDDVQKRWAHNQRLPGFTCLVGTEENQIVAASWWDTPTNAELAHEYGDALEQFVREQFPNQPIVWIRAMFITPDAQGRGLAQLLGKTTIEHIRSKIPHAICLLRMRDDNVRIIRTNERIGFCRTNIKTPSKEPEVSYDYWYLPMR